MSFWKTCVFAGECALDNDLAIVFGCERDVGVEGRGVAADNCFDMVGNQMRADNRVPSDRGIRVWSLIRNVLMPVIVC